ncbi:MAG: DUF2840 domain-containing protein [Pseudomonadota bacterium]
MSTAARAVVPPPNLKDAERLTRIDLLHRTGAVEHWVRFGRAAAETVIDRRRRAFWYHPGAVIAFVRWRANVFGTVVSRIDILTAGTPGDAISTIPGVTPGGVSLLRLEGWPAVQQALAAIDGVEALNVDPADACPGHWRQVHHHLSARSSPRAYSLARHRAWLLRQEVSSC